MTQRTSLPIFLIVSSFQERSRASRLQSELQMGVVSQRALSELQEMVADLRAEKELLKEANERLTKRWEIIHTIINKFCILLIYYL